MPRALPSQSAGPAVNFPVGNLENETGSEAYRIHRALLLDHVLNPWFPRCIDRQHGGFLCDFDRRWRSLGPDDKLLEFQARQMLAAAEAQMAFPSNPVFREAVSIGFAFLREVMWDGEFGGWFGRTDRQGRPANSGIKHAHGTAYAIQACVAVYLATGNRAAFDLAIAGFDWLEANAHDPANGGYFGAMRRDGSRIADSHAGADFDHTGAPFGQKDMNVNKDLLSALGDICMYCPEPTRVRERFDELLEIILRHFARDTFPWSYRCADWTPSSDYWRPSEAAQLAGILMEVRPLSDDANVIEDRAYHLLCTAYRFGWQPRIGALVFDHRADGRVTSRQLGNAQWWAQFELLKAAEYMQRVRPGDAKLTAIAADARDSVLHLVDKRFTGITRLRIDSLSPVERIRRGRRWLEASRKGDQWKDASHDARCLLRIASLARDAAG